MSKNSPGPWRIERNCGHPHIEIWEGAKQRLAYMQDHIAESEANARLIAAAPDLLCAMQELFEQCVMVHRYGGDGCNQKEADAAIKAGFAAIAKATEGEEGK